MQICSVLKDKIFLIIDQKGVTALTASGNNSNKLLQLIAKLYAALWIVLKLLLWEYSTIQTKPYNLSRSFVKFRIKVWVFQIWL